MVMFYPFGDTTALTASAPRRRSSFSTGAPGSDTTLPPLTWTE
jgi:hypothetical protein